MGMRNLRAICPNCGGKIHTQAKGLGKLSLWGNSWFLVETGKVCQHCGHELTGKVDAGGKAVAADAAKSYGAGPVATATPATAVKTTTATSYLAANSAGWFPDPAERFDLRYFSGAFWTNKVADASGAERTDPKPIATAR